MKAKSLGEVESRLQGQRPRTRPWSSTSYPAGPGGETAVEFAINPALLREAFAADLPDGAPR